MDFYTFWDNITHYKTRSVHFLGLLNSATEAEEGVLVFSTFGSAFPGSSSPRGEDDGSESFRAWRLEV